MTPENEIGGKGYKTLSAQSLARPNTLKKLALETPAPKHYM